MYVVCQECGMHLRTREDRRAHVGARIQESKDNKRTQSFASQLHPQELHAVKWSAPCGQIREIHADPFDA